MELTNDHEDVRLAEGFSALDDDEQLDEEEVTEEDIAQLELTRIAKAKASRECNARKRWRKQWMAEHDGQEPTDADMPDELRIVRKAKAEDGEAEAEAQTPLEVVVEEAPAAAEEKPKRKSRKKAEAAA